MWIDVDGGRLFVAIDGGGPPLLMLHGWTLDHRAFAPQTAELSRHLTTIAPDRRGFGRSTAPPGLVAEIDDIDRILDALGLDDVHLLGMSQGARVALRYAALRPPRLRSLIVQGAVVDGLTAEADDPERIPLTRYIALAEAGRLDALREAWLAHPMMSLAGVDANAAALVHDIVAGYQGRDLVGGGEGRYDVAVDVPERLRSFDAPALIITGAAETATRRAHAAALETLLPAATRIEFDDAGHLCNLSSPDTYNEAVLGFVQAVERDRR